MLKATFSCFDGLGRSAEIKIWQAGCLSWDLFDLLPQGTFSAKKLQCIRSQFDAAEKALSAEIPDYFVNRLCIEHLLRVSPDFSARSAILDIETTGLSPKDTITTITLLKSGRLSVFVQRVNLDDFLNEIAEVKLLYTFNGARFDLPFLRKHFKIDLAIAHIDVMHVARSYGLTGGQKAIEKAFKLDRTFSKGEAGKDAILFWNKWKEQGDAESLRQLIKYNIEDVLMLDCIVRRLYEQSMAGYPLKCTFNGLSPADISVRDVLRQLDL